MAAFPDLPAYAWIALTLVTAGAVGAMLRSLGTVAVAEIELHDLRVQVHTLHMEYRRRLLELNGGHEGTSDDPIEAIPIDDDGNELTAY